MLEGAGGARVGRGRGIALKPGRSIAWSAARATGDSQENPVLLLRLLRLRCGRVAGWPRRLRRLRRQVLGCGLATAGAELAGTEYQALMLRLLPGDGGRGDSAESLGLMTPAAAGRQQPWRRPGGFR